MPLSAQPAGPPRPAIGSEILVAGSGAAGLTAALTAAAAGARVTLAERAGEIGGTTALSFGRVWIPAPGDRTASEYLIAVYGDRYPRMIEAFLAAAPEMAEFVQRHSRLRFTPCETYPDYHPGLPGAARGGRALDVVPVISRELNGRVRQPPGYLPITHADWERWRYPARYDRAVLADRLSRGVLAGGTALAAALLDAVIRDSVRILTRTRLTGVRLGPAGAVDGAVLTAQDGRVTTVSVNAVIMATGGFDRDTQLRERCLPSAVAATGAVPTNTGDAMRIAEHLGAVLENTSEAWWMPMMSVPGETYDGEPYYRSLIRERALPRQVIVNERGRRFADEALPYNEFVKAMLARSRTAWMIFDGGYRQRFPVPGTGHGDPVPEWVIRADSPAALAAAIDIPPGEFSAAVARWNANCTAGTDPDFGRGGTVYERYLGDPDTGPSPNLGPLDHPPFYAIRVLPGTIGTKGGPITDTNARVLRDDGSPVTGLYAVGNAAAFWTSDGYPGPGATLGTAMTMGYLAGRDVAAGVSSNLPR